ncbi:hypothetical protein SLEP1_g41380 [Rubroshorea leprosula]|uniref:Uncharacterized protein n=1 Tax=Rubroshorea leprosula TaxID=152421 RepID=A0AAV5L6W4_9ROSI|nr:hypothetical protein SLEP1_g41380 [Rubroshorea leprosula]
MVRYDSMPKWPMTGSTGHLLANLPFNPKPLYFFHWVQHCFQSLNTKPTTVFLSPTPAPSSYI